MAHRVPFHESRRTARRGFVVEYGPGPVVYVDDRLGREQRALARIEWILLLCGYTVARDGDMLEVTRTSWTRG